MTPWKILIVDDEEGIHGITRMIFRDYEFEQRPIELISAMSSIQAREQLEQHPDIALILLDVVMETEHAGLQLVSHIREQLNNHDVRIILRTGHPGYAPEAQVIIDYDINDYLSKAELSASRLLTSVIIALRSYRDIQTARQPEAQYEAPVQDDPLPATAAALSQQLQPALRQARRLQKLELNPVARETAGDLIAHQERLNNSISLLDCSQLPPLTTSPLNLIQMLHQIQQVFLPQSRQEGWVLDAWSDPLLPEAMVTDERRMNMLMISATELALLQARGADLRLSLKAGETTGELVVQVEQTEGQPLFSRAPWPQLLRRQLQQLCQQLQGRFTEIDEGGVICCRILTRG